MRVVWSHNTKHEQNEFQLWDIIEHEQLDSGNFAITIVTVLAFTLKIAISFSFIGLTLIAACCQIGLHCFFVVVLFSKEDCFIKTKFVE